MHSLLIDLNIAEAHVIHKSYAATTKHTLFIHHTPQHKLFADGILTPVPLFCLLCTIISNKTGIFDLYQNTPQVLAARSLLVAGFDTHVIPRWFSCGVYDFFWYVNGILSRFILILGVYTCIASRLVRHESAGSFEYIHISHMHSSFWVYKPSYVCTILVDFNVTKVLVLLSIYTYLICNHHFECINIHMYVPFDCMYVWNMEYHFENIQ